MDPILLGDAVFRRGRSRRSRILTGGECLRRSSEGLWRCVLIADCFRARFRDSLEPARPWRVSSAVGSLEVLPKQGPRCADGR
jgi:hypothetical protein